MSASADLRRAWVERVLGVSVGHREDGGKPGAGDITARLRAARAAWLTAIEMVDGQINALAAALQGTDDEDLHRIASTGLMTVTGRFRTRMMAALMGLGDGDGRPAQERREGRQVRREVTCADRRRCAGDRL
jgi:hypothetical protein